MSYSERYEEFLRTISKVTKTGFRISTRDGKEETILFSLNGGYQKGLNSKMDMGHHSQCHLITEEEEAAIRNEWRIDTETKEFKKYIKEKIDTLTYNQLKTIKSIIETK